MNLSTFYLPIAFLLSGYLGVDGLVCQNQRGHSRTTSLAMMTEEIGGKDNHGRRAFLATAASAFAFGMPLASHADDETFHRIDYPVAGKCGQAEVPENAVFFVKTFGGFTEGSCAVEGYTVAEGTANGTGEKDKQRTYNIYGKE